MKLNRYLETTIAIFVTLLCLYYVGQLRGFLTDVWAVVSAVLLPFVLALVLTYILQPVVDLLTKRRVPRTAAILLIYAVLVLILVIIFMNAIPTATRQVNQLIEYLPSLVHDVNGYIDLFAKKKQYLPDAVRLGIEGAITQIEQTLTGSISHIFGVLSSAVGTIFAMFVVPFLVFYMLKDGKSMGRGFLRLFPESKREKVRDILTGVDHTLGSYIRGQMLVMFAVGVLTYIGYLIVRMPYAILLAFFLAVADMIPYLGPFIGVAPALLLAIPLGWPMVVKVLIVNVIVQQCEGNFLSPQIMGRTLRLHPMAIVAALLIGGELGGFVGLVAAIPLLAVAKVLWMQLVRDEDEIPAK